MTAGQWDANRKLRILYVAYSLLPVSENSAGGAEQVLWTLEREIHARGHLTTVAACDGSRVAGALFETGEPAVTLDQFELRAKEQRGAILQWLSGTASPDFDLIHDMSGGFWQHSAGLQIPVLATLHLPRCLYKDFDAWEFPEAASFNCVSHSQLSEFPHLPRLLGALSNGIALDRFPKEPVATSNREYLLWLGRICEEKGTHTALDVAEVVGEKIIIAGAVYPFLYHQKYFAREVIPRMKRAGNRARYIDRPSFAEKIELLRNARALLITSEVNETSSLVAMEAAACGTPIIALRRGALPEVLADQVTGYLVDDAEEMATALKQIGDINSLACREYAEQHYSSSRMADEYLDVYRKVLHTTAIVPTRPLQAQRP